MIKKISNSTKLIIRLAAILLIVFMAGFLHNIISIKEQQITRSIEKEAYAIESNLNERFGATALVINEMGRKILSNPTNKQHIHNVLLSAKSNESLKRIFAWTIFSWSTPEAQLTVDEEYGMLKTPIDLSSRDYIPISITSPNRIFFGKPVIGSTSKTWMIPAGTSFADNNGKVIGTITTGFNIAEIKKIVSDSIHDKNISATLLFKGDKVLSTNKLEQDLKYEEKYSVKKSLSVNQDYELIFSYDKAAISSLMNELIYSRILEVLGMAILAGIIIITLIKNEKTKRKQVEYLAQRESEISLTKTVFLRMVSHELKNFIFGIESLAEIVKSDLSLLPEKFKDGIEHLNHIEEIGEEIAKYVDDLADLNAHEDGQFSISQNLESTDVSDLIDRCLRVMRSKIRNQDVKVINKIDGTKPIMLRNVDQKRLKQVIVGILQNALKHSDKGSSIEINADHIENKTFISIKDSGYGMTQEQLKSSLLNFEPTKDSTERFDCMQLRLPIINYLIQQQGGSLQIKSTPKLGTEVILFFFKSK